MHFPRYVMRFKIGVIIVTSGLYVIILFSAVVYRSLSNYLKTKPSPQMLQSLKVPGAIAKGFLQHISDYPKTFSKIGILILVAL